MIVDPASSSLPTGAAYNANSGFKITSGTTTAPSRYLFATRNGTIAGFNAAVDPASAIIAVDNSAAGAVYTGLAIAGKAIKEARYHQQHAADWVVRLGDGTDESHRRMQAALAQLWRFTPELLESDAVDQAAQAAGLGPACVPLVDLHRGCANLIAGKHSGDGSWRIAYD